jgi:hypothetical protein
MFADMVRYLRERTQPEDLKVLVPLLASAESANLPEPVDVIMVAATYHHIDHRIAYFTKLRGSHCGLMDDCDRRWWPARPGMPAIASTNFRRERGARLQITVRQPARFPA